MLDIVLALALSYFALGAAVLDAFEADYLDQDIAPYGPPLAAERITIWLAWPFFGACRWLAFQIIRAGQQECYD